MKSDYSIGDVIGRQRCFGVYQTADDVPTFGVDVYDNKEYCKYYDDFVIPDVEQRMRKTGFTAAAYDSYLLSLLALVRSEIREKGNVNIVDFGGGQGENYIRLESYFGSEKMEYYVIEQPGNCEFGEMRHLSENIHFCENIDAEFGFLNGKATELLKKADICLLIGCVQLCFPYTDLLKEIAESGVEYIFMARTPVNRLTDTFYSRYYLAPDAGKYKDVVLGDARMAIINYKELLENMQQLKYDLRLDLYERLGFVVYDSLPAPYNEIEYRNMIFQASNSKIM